MTTTGPTRLTAVVGAHAGCFDQNNFNSPRTLRVNSRTETTDQPMTRHTLRFPGILLLTDGDKQPS